jgi:hypothetical protein
MQGYKQFNEPRLDLITNSRNWIEINFKLKTLKIVSFERKNN